MPKSICEWLGYPLPPVLEGLSRPVAGIIGNLAANLDWEFDVAILPYRFGEPNYSGSATRFYEHLAACRPMLATPNVAELQTKQPSCLSQATPTTSSQNCTNCKPPNSAMATSAPAG